ncbi:putative AAA-ATPase [Gregarina niphandrodes]|uniref:AAA-ATPase n=1 Tax=Gregarina niphandrodes TaxID=110365 RepID=A0A023B0V0_GRENI|nr:putative AAA-ATPase [Gregarina niphandrodes]EZG45975.1 putative AAA-ATPase [Gregarina niphandrodes]|eukprot:XP_011132402.1 putative AAA-ATPase [Gregarina niphandrodes]
MEYSLGVSEFAQLRNLGACYVDKTEILHQIVTTCAACFLTRPRRFGKTLLLSTVEAYFRGEQTLFAGLRMEKLETQWLRHAVLRLDLSSATYNVPQDLVDVLHRHLSEWEQLYCPATRTVATPTGTDASVQADTEDTSTQMTAEGVTPNPVAPNRVGSRQASLHERFAQVIKCAFEASGGPVVVLVDGYDKPVLDGLMADLSGEESLRVRIRQDRARVFAPLDPFYSVLKSARTYLKFVMLAGVSRYDMGDVFGCLDYLEDLSLDATCGAVCGFTRSELLKYYAKGLSFQGLRFSEGSSRQGLGPQGRSAPGLSGPVLSRQGSNCQGSVTIDAKVVDLCEGADGLVKEEEELVSRLEEWFGGYSFAPGSQRVVHPWSFLNALKRGSIRPYWLDFTTASYLAQTVRCRSIRLAELDNMRTDTQSLRTFGAVWQRVLMTGDAVGVLYQTGCLTLKECELNCNEYVLGYPNREVKEELFKFVLKHAGHRHLTFPAMDLRHSLQHGDAVRFIQGFKQFMGSIRYTNHPYPNHPYPEPTDAILFENVLFLVCELLQDERTKIQSSINIGHTELCIQTSNTTGRKYLYLIGLSRTVSTSLLRLQQSPFAYDAHDHIVITVGASIKHKTIKGWTIQTK